MDEAPRKWDWFRLRCWILALAFFGLGLIGIFAVASDDLAWYRKLLGLTVFFLLTLASGYGMHRLRRPLGRP